MTTWKELEKQFAARLELGRRPVEHLERELVGPLEIVEHEEQGLFLGEPADRRVQCPDETLAGGLRRKPRQIRIRVLSW